MANSELFQSLVIPSPKRKRNRRQHGCWDAFFPYYAGYPESFAKPLLASMKLAPGSTVFDPWNGSGTTTYAAAQLSLSSWGFDLNPVMLVVARARLLPDSEADSLKPLTDQLVAGLPRRLPAIDPSDPLRSWFSDRSAAVLRAIERQIRAALVGHLTITDEGTKLEHLSSIAATFYVALFSLCRLFAAEFQSSNPTWIKKPKLEAARIDLERSEITDAFRKTTAAMAGGLSAQASLLRTDHSKCELRVADTASESIDEKLADAVLTSPPYCTRIDYAAATRIELSILHELVEISAGDLARRMIGSTRVPIGPVERRDSWGSTCLQFLEALEKHPSKASSGYYLKTHLDYFDKMERALGKVATSLKIHAPAILVVQDSYYKEIHNDLPTIISEIATSKGLKLRRRDNFHMKQTMAGINPYTRTYNRQPCAVEAVLSFEKISN